MARTAFDCLMVLKQKMKRRAFTASKSCSVFNLPFKYGFRKNNVAKFVTLKRKAAYFLISYAHDDFNARAPTFVHRTTGR